MPFKNKPAIAVVLSDEDVFSLPKGKLKGADLIELRVDMFREIEKVREVFTVATKKYGLPILCTVRATHEGGEKKIINRLAIYKSVLPLCNFFDIEIFSKEAKSLRQLTKGTKLKLIGSYHNFKETPSTEEMERIFEKGRNLGFDIVKIATMVNAMEDLERLLQLTIRHRDNGIIVIGMGNKGIPSRVINPIFGSLVTYASLNRTSAPGQIALSELVRIFKLMGLRDD